MAADVLPDPGPVLQIVEQAVCHFVVYQGRYYDDAPDNAVKDIHFLIVPEISVHKQHVDDAGAEITKPSGKVNEYYQNPHRNGDVWPVKIFSDVNSHYIGGKLQQLILHVTVREVTVKCQVKSCFGNDSHYDHEDHVFSQTPFILTQMVAAINDH